MTVREEAQQWHAADCATMPPHNCAHAIEDLAEKVLDERLRERDELENPERYGFGAFDP